jgi:hypothetical protein
MKKEYRVLKLHDSLPAGAQVDDVIEITDYAVACSLVEAGVLESLNTHVQG